MGNINGWDGSPETQPELSKEFLEERSIRIIPFNQEIKEKSLKEFDSIVEEIENSIQLETEGKTILNTWKYNAKSHACRSCDFHYICPAYKGRSIPTVP